MPEFTPPTYNLPVSAERSRHGSMWGHFGRPIQTAFSVIITDEVATPAPGRAVPTIAECNNADAGSGEGGLAWFRGGIVYTITDAEQTILEEAGYEFDE